MAPKADHSCITVFSFWVSMDGLFMVRLRGHGENWYLMYWLWAEVSNHNLASVSAIGRYISIPPEASTGISVLVDWWYNYEFLSFIPVHP
eukprot:m51a1_g11475 hypothetical protein (90) ;mRNA; r:2092-3569